MPGAPRLRARSADSGARQGPVIKRRRSALKAAPRATSRGRLDTSNASCHTSWMTTRGRLNARLEPELERKLAYLRQRTGLATSAVVRASIERFYEAMRTGGQQARAILEESGFIASGSGPADLSERYKEELNESLSKKHR